MAVIGSAMAIFGLKREKAVWLFAALVLSVPLIGCIKSPAPLTSAAPTGKLPTFTGLRFLRELPGSAAASPLAFSPNDQILVTGGIPNTVQLWSVPSGKLLLTLSGHKDTIFTAAFSPNGKNLAGGSGRTVKLWNVQTGQLVRTLNGHTDQVTAVCFSSQGRTLASSSMDKTVKLWDVQTGKEQRTLKGHVRSIYALALSPDNMALASGSWDGTLRVWNLKSGQARWTWRNRNPDPIYRVAFSSDGTKLINLLHDSQQGTVLHILSSQSGLLLRSSPMGAATTSVSLSADARYFAQLFSSAPEWGQSSAEINILEMGTGKIVSKLSTSGDSFASPVLSSNGKLLAVLIHGAKQNAVSLWARK